MVTPDDLGKEVRIVAAGAFYAYVDGWMGTLVGFPSGYADVAVPGHENGEDVTKHILIPPDEVVLNEQP